jgi:phosphoglycolate phosphatase-like HAD superfamily hydrolase
MPTAYGILPTFSGAVDLLPTFVPRPQISHVVLDFDGTLSWVRHGWPAIMESLFRDHLPAIAGESADAVTSVLKSVILGMNGRPTIRQMMRFAEIVAERSGPRLDPEELRTAYQSRLDVEIAQRAHSIQRGHATQDDFVVFGARPFLEFLWSQSITLIVLSSTVQERVREEAELLGLTGYFGERIYGGTGDPTQFSKKTVLERILQQDGIAGDRLLSIGDGPIELSSAKELGGLAIGVCSDENHNGSGVMDSFKYAQLRAAGADALVADFRDMIALVTYLLGK